MNEKQFARQLALLRKESNMTQEDLAKQLHVSPQAISKWENGHSLPETALLPQLARILDVSIDDLFRDGRLIIIEAVFGDGVEAIHVTKRLNRLIENNTLNVLASSSILGVTTSEERVAYLTLKYQSLHGICYKLFLEGELILLDQNDIPIELPDSNSALSIIAGRYGTKRYNYDVMPKIEHYKTFNWSAYPANHQTFPSDPANDQTEYLSLIYINSSGIHMATCAEGECLEYINNKTTFIRRSKSKEYYIPDVPELPPFGAGMDCSWGAALTSALQAMKVETTYEEVMGVSGACYRIAFCSPNWDYSSVDGLVTYDYATPGFAAFGYTPEHYAHIEKADRGIHRQRIIKEISFNKPVLAINLRVAPEWGVICGYGNDGEDLYCRTKYDRQTIENDPVFTKGFPLFDASKINNRYNYLYVDNWPFLLIYFSENGNQRTKKENLINSLKVFTDSMTKVSHSGYSMGFKAYEVWASDLRDDVFYENCDERQLTHRFLVNQFCMLSLLDARRSASSFLSSSVQLFNGEQHLLQIAQHFAEVHRIVEDIHTKLDTRKPLETHEYRQFWTLALRHEQANALDHILNLEREAHLLALDFISKNDK